ncbi:MAG: hypothetical protein C5B53_09500 [Candidatus Melainabacteria bacterium]|nr:MAG: hypothetical protein C5B53_09500 [Candidatus Melainabacteria bacterium]
MSLSKTPQLKKEIGRTERFAIRALKVVALRKAIGVYFTWQSRYPACGGAGSTVPGFANAYIALAI